MSAAFRALPAASTQRVDVVEFSLPQSAIQSAQSMLDPTTVVSISELNRLARQSLEREFPLLWVAGEISNLTRATSGHVYFSLKDESAQARCVMFRSRSQSIPWRLENGQQVEARALVSLYESRGDYQLNIETLRRAGMGRLFEAFARLKARLDAEGLFAAERKRPLPRFPRRVGIISSPSAAALRDVLVAIKRRAPHLTAILYPTLVQGDHAAEHIADAIALAGQRNECDLLLIVRGGGSIEDLWAFNEEIVVRAIVASPLPIISGVGHETDTSITDYVADLRAATPTAAAELGTQGWHEAIREIADIRTALGRGMQYRVAREQQTLDHLSLRLIHPTTRLAQARDRLALLGSRLDASLARIQRRHRDRLNRVALGLGRCVPSTERHSGHIGLLSQRLGAALREQHQKRLSALDHIAAGLAHLNPEATLARGFSIIRDASGQLVTDAARLQTGQTVSLYLARGGAEARILARTSDLRPIAT
jgi:exodeoxyribonuclease VII large subunit